MTRWDGAIPTVGAFVIAAVLFVPSDVARADLLGGLTDVLDETVETVETVVDDTVATTAGVVDDTLGSTGTGLDEAVGDLTDGVVSTSDALTDVVSQTTDGLTDTVDDASAAILPTEDTPSTTTTTTTPTTTTTVPSTTTTSPSRDGASALPATDESVSPPPGSFRIADDVEQTAATSTAASREAPSGDSTVPAGVARESLTVLSAAGGFTDRPVPEPVRLGQAFDSSLYGRLLSWLSTAGEGFGALLLGPLLALEIVIRALLSAGSGLVAPISLLGAYVMSLVWRARGPRPAALPS